MAWSTSELRVRLALLDRFKPSSKIFYWPFQGGTSYVDLLWFFLSCVCYVFVHVCLYVLCGHLLGKGLTSWLSVVVSNCVVSNCALVTFPLVSWVRCGTWLYRFLIFAPLLTSNPWVFIFFFLSYSFRGHRQWRIQKGFMGVPNRVFHFYRDIQEKWEIICKSTPSLIYLNPVSWSRWSTFEQKGLCRYFRLYRKTSERRGF